MALRSKLKLRINVTDKHATSSSTRPRQIKVQGSRAHVIIKYVFYFGIIRIPEGRKTSADKFSRMGNKNKHIMINYIKLTRGLHASGNC